MKALWSAIAFVIAIGFAGQADAEIRGNLEGPKIGVQVSNVQGWAYTTTPGAELIQPFPVRIDGVEVMVVPCCSGRGDVRDQHPEAPLDTGFAGVFNWGLLGGGGDFVEIEVIVRDTKGGELVLRKEVPTFALSDEFPFFHEMQVDAAPFFGGAGLRRGYCTISNNVLAPTTGPAELQCWNLIASRNNPGGFPLGRTCDGVRFGWDRATQGFVQTSDCLDLPRWTEHPDGTATDNYSGLVWEVKTDDGSIHDIDNTYSFGSGTGLRDGTAFVEFLSELNSSTSTNGFSDGGCFASQCDWRLPTLEELREIDPLAGSAVCGDECVAPPGESSATTFWTSTASSDPSLAWLVHFGTGESIAAGAFGGSRVRAVRGSRKRLVTQLF